MNHTISQLKKYLSLQGFLVFLGVLWVFYSVMVSTSGICDYYTVQIDGDWYVKYLEFERDDIGNRDYEMTEAGPISEQEANKILADCKKQASDWMKTYGSVYQ